MAIAVRTDYNKVGIGSLDPLWVGKVQAGGSGTVKTVAAPWDASKHAQEHVVHDGDVLYGGERCEVLNGKIGSKGGGGTRLQLGFKIWLPKDFDSSSSGWNSLYDFHYSGNDIQQSPITGSIRNDLDYWVSVKGGPFKIDRGSKERVEKLATLKLETLHTILMDIYFSMTDGMFDCWVDGKKVAEWRLPTITTDHGENSTYWKQGFYRNQSESGTERYYFDDTVCWYNGAPAEMLAYYGNTTPVPIPPDPPDPPAGSIKGSIANGAVLKQTVTWTANAGPCIFTVDGKLPWTENLSPYVYNGDGGVLDTTKLTDGEHKLKVALVSGGASDEVTVTVDNVTGPPDPPTHTNAELADLAEAALKLTTVGYVQWKKNVDANKYPDVTKTQWWIGLNYMEQIK